MSEFEQAAALLAPLLVGGIFHGLCMKFRWLPVLVRPIDAGRTFRGRRLFGQNKTYRGVIAVGLGTALGYLLQALIVGSKFLGHEAAWLGEPTFATFLFGFLMGAAAMLAELPNSFLKRQWDIQSGEQARGIVGIAFSALDQVDMLIGALIVWALTITLTPALILWSVAILLVVHQGFSIVSYSLGMRSTWR